MWIHPDYNDQYCHYYLEAPGDISTFYVTRSYSDAAEEPIDGLETVDDLVNWPEALKHGDVQ